MSSNSIHYPKLKDLTGQRFGRLTVIDRGPNAKEQTRWNCVCDCGAATLVFGSSLRNGNTQSCGCLHVGCQLKDLSGSRFGKWLVIDRAPDMKAQTYWNCVCDCGNHRIVAAASLVRGLSKSCGCLCLETVMTMEQFLDKHVPNRQPGQCWLWTGAIGPTGYGSCRWKRKTRAAHRLVYEHLIGPVPEGLELDHLCKTRHCVNPAHLEPVTHAENLRRGINYWRDRTHCISGHEYTAETIRWRPTGHRICRICEQEKHRRQFGWQGGPWNRDKTQCPKGHAYDEPNTYINRRGDRLCRECTRLRSRMYRASH